MEPEICTKMLKKLSEKLRKKFPAKAPGINGLKTLSVGLAEV